MQLVLCSNALQQCLYIFAKSFLANIYIITAHQSYKSSCQSQLCHSCGDGGDGSDSGDGSDEDGGGDVGDSDEDGGGNVGISKCDDEDEKI